MIEEGEYQKYQREVLKQIGVKKEERKERKERGANIDLKKGQFTAIVKGLMLGPYLRIIVFLTLMGFIVLLLFLLGLL